MKLAIIGNSSFGYLDRLAKHATARGAPTVFFDERPSNDVRTKLLLRLPPKAIVHRIGGIHIRQVCERILAGGFTHVLIVFAEVIGAEDIRRLKAHGLTVSRYTWDSLMNRPHVKGLDPLMDCIGSFDHKDCAAQGYTYIPLYSEQVPERTLSAAERSHDFYFCGTMHSNRPRLITGVLDACSRRGWTSLMKLFYHSRKLYVLRYIADAVALGLCEQISEVGFPHAETLQDCAETRVVIDIHHPQQSGLTMRTFEALAHGAVLLTTNRAAQHLLDESLHARVAFLDLERIEDSMEKALAAQSGPLSAAQRHVLSVDRFLDQIFALVGIPPPPRHEMYPTLLGV